jgi:hypothetical protein
MARKKNSGKSKKLTGKSKTERLSEAYEELRTMTDQKKAKLKTKKPWYKRIFKF